MKSIN
jgi:hypothetical protein